MAHMTDTFFCMICGRKSPFFSTFVKFKHFDLFEL